MQYDPRGALTLIWDSRGRGTRQEHDIAGNLVRVEHQGSASFTYSFDEASNLFEQGDGRIYDSGGRLARRGATSFRYNEEGKLIEKSGPAGSEVWRYEWTETGRLRAVVTPGNERIEYVYDCFGRRLQKRSSSGTVRYVWDGDDLLHEVQSSTDTTAPAAIRTYLFAPETWVPVAHRDGSPDQMAGEGWVHYVTDDIGTPALLVDEHGTQVRDVERSPWGSPLSDSPTPIGMLGQYIDADTGLAYNRFRYYDPETGRYLSPDPLGLEGGANLYGYPPDPTRWADPLALAFSKKTKDKALQDNRDNNGGVVKCEECGVECVKPQKSMKGDTAEKRPSMLQEWQGDHIHPESKGGKDDADNCQILCRSCNRTKSNKT